MHPSYQAKESGERQVDVWDTAGMWEKMRIAGPSGETYSRRTPLARGAEQRRCSRPTCDLSGLFICSGDVHNMRQQLDV